MKGGNQTELSAHKTGLTFDLNSTKWPPQVKEFVAFEHNLIKLVKNFRFRKVDNTFQRTLAKDLKNIRYSNRTAAGKTSNMYRFRRKQSTNLSQQ